MIARLIRYDRRGSAIVEFAMLFGPMMALLLGGIEAGNLAYSRSVLEGSLRVAARMATTGKYSAQDIDTYVRDQMEIIGVEGTAVEITRRAYSSFESVSNPEPLTSDVAPTGGTPSSGDCYLDLNGDSQWSADSGSAGNGESEDILYYGVEVEYGLLFPFLADALGGENGRLTLKANTVVKNEPFGEGRDPAAERCIA